MKAMKIKYKLTLGFLVVALLAGVTTFFTLRSYSGINTVFATLIEDPTTLVETLNDLKNGGLQIVSSTNEYLLIHAETNINDTSVAKEREEIQLRVDGVEAFQNALGKYQRHIELVAPDEKDTVENIRSSGARLIETSGEMIALTKLNVHGNLLMDKSQIFEREETTFLKIVNPAIEKEKAEQINGQQKVNETVAFGTKGTLISTALSFIAALLAGFYIAQRMAKRLGKLRDAVRTVGTGKFDISVESGSSDEIGDLAASFESMAINLRSSHEAVVSSKAFTENIISSIGDALFVLDIDLNIVRVNQATLDLTGLSNEELIGSSIKDLRKDGGFFSEQDIKELHEKSSVNGVETYLTLRDERNVSILFSASLMTNADGISDGIVCMAHDITDIKTLESQLTQQALHDSLTGLANRVLFRDRVEHALTRVDRKHSPVAVLFLDLDNFKNINDTLGHAAGDELLVSVAQRLQACLRTSDTAARLGGDEFAVLVEDTTDTDGAALVAERIRDILRPSFLVGGKEITIGTSIGIATTEDGNEDPEALLRNADVAMYMAKSEGKDRYAVFETEMHSTIVKRVELEDEMRKAIDAEEFEVHYQPIVDLNSGKVMGVEALTRWRHPVRGLIAPLDFIPIAEENGLIIPLGKWILEEACQQARKWHIQYDCESSLSVTVNISSGQFQDESMIQIIADTLAITGLDPTKLVLEITESTMLKNTNISLTKLRKVKELGVRLAIDDFGTGYSSLSYLQQFPIDILKIDKSFVDKISQTKEGSAVARAIITMSDTLHMRTIAEGVETPDQTATLKKLGCEYGQGYLFAKPLPKKEMALFLQKAMGRGVIDELNIETLPNANIESNLLALSSR
ncbi:MAG: EAL domain-containing protein [Acidobacteriota bacterium]